MPLEGEYEPSPWEPIATQVAQYETTDGREGGEMEGAPCVILTTKGRRSGKLRKTPLIRVERDGRYAVVASMGGAPQHPVWYLNLLDNPLVMLQDGAQVADYSARELHGEEKADWWAESTKVWPSYDDYQASTERQIPLVLLEPVE
jgi:F420H(2)-dependent quinone reductase